MHSLDGRDTPPISAQPSLEKLDALFAQYPGQGRICDFNRSSFCNLTGVTTVGDRVEASLPFVD